MGLKLPDMAKPFARAAIRVRRWDDAAKIAGAKTPPLDHFLEITARCISR